MRRKDLEILNKEDLLNILRKAEICRIGINTDNAPYIVPMNYGFCWENNLNIYLHSYFKGTKLNLIKRDNKVGFEIDLVYDLVKNNSFCKWSMNYESIVGDGVISSINDENEKTFALDKLMEHYGVHDKKDYNPRILDKLSILKLEVLNLTGKRNIK